MTGRLDQLLLTVHIVGFVMWVGPLLATGRLVVARAGESEVAMRDRYTRMARKTALLADIGATLAILTGVWLLLRLSLYKVGWMHIKLTLAFFLFLLHGYLRMTVKRAERSLPAAILPILVVLMIGIVAAVIFQPAL